MGKLVLSLEGWRIGGEKLKPLGDTKGARRFAAVQELREELGLPHHVAVVERDHVLPVDLCNTLSIESFVHVVKARPDVTRAPTRAGGSRAAGWINCSPMSGLTSSRSAPCSAARRGLAVGVLTERALGAKYRKERASLEALLDRAKDANSPLAPGLTRLAERSAHMRVTAAELTAAEKAGKLMGSIVTLAESYLHMLANRLLRGAAREQELILYDLLGRHDLLGRCYASCAGRARRAS
jgi:hypothetical protein